MRMRKWTYLLTVGAAMLVVCLAPSEGARGEWNWAQVNDSGFAGYPFRQSSWSLAYFDEYLYAGTSTPGILYRTDGWTYPETTRYRWRQVSLPTSIPDGRTFEPNRIGRLTVLEGDETSFLYAVAHDDTRDVLFRTSNGRDWELCHVWYPRGLGGHGHGGGLYSSGAVTAMTVHNGQIWFSLGNASGGGVMMARAFGASDPNEVIAFHSGLDIGDRTVGCMKSFGGGLYVATTRPARTVQIWRQLPSSPTWEKVLEIAGTPSGGAQSMEVFGGALYVGLMGSGGTTPVRLWRSEDGADWTQVETDGQFDSRRTEIRCLKTFGDYLYAGLGGNAAEPAPVARIYKSADGSAWEEITPGELSSDLNNVNVGSMAVAWDALFFGTAVNTHTGTEIWRYREEDEDAGPGVVAPPARVRYETIKKPPERVILPPEGKPFLECPTPPTPPGPPEGMQKMEMKPVIAPDSPVSQPGKTVLPMEQKMKIDLKKIMEGQAPLK